MPITDVESALREGYLPPTTQYKKSSQSDEKLPDEIVYISDSEAESDVGRDPKKSAITKVFDNITARMGSWGMETNGITPVPEVERTDKRIYQVFFVWFSSSANLLTLSAGTVGPAYYNLGILDSFYVILIVDTVTNVVPAFFTTFGPKLGTRAMVQSRFSWGYYGAIIPSVLNAVSLEGALILNVIIAGQVFAETSDHLNATLGIVVVSLGSLAVTLCGCNFLHQLETIAWIPTVIAFIVMLVVGWKDLVNAPLTSPEPVTAAALLTFGAALSATTISWATLTPDYGVYHDTKASAWRVFWYSYWGFMVAGVPCHMMGAAFTAAARSVPAWQAGLQGGSDLGGLIAAILAPTGRFGKFLLVVLTLMTPAATALALYTACTSLMTAHRAFARLPRFVVAIIGTVILIPTAIVGATSFYDTFVDIFSIMGYWIAPFCAIVMTEHFVFRRSFDAYDVLAAWDTRRHPNLPRSWPAITAFLVSIGAIIPCMEQEWYIGPIARKGTGDLGQIVGSVVGAGTYALARWAERRWGVKRYTA